MAEQHHITRRAALVGALAAGALATLPAMAVQPQRETYSSIMVDGVLVTVDTSDLPDVQRETEHKGVGRPVTFIYSRPKLDTPYVVITADGDLAVTTLLVGSDSWGAIDGRLGYMPTVDRVGRRTNCRCVVLGRVVERVFAE